jgi:hypothetical protein
MTPPHVSDGGDGLQIRRVAAIVLYDQSQIANKGGPLGLELSGFAVNKTACERGNEAEVFLTAWTLHHGVSKKTITYGL